VFRELSERYGLHVLETGFEGVTMKQQCQPLRGSGVSLKD
jgi:hypothetical protein